MTDSLDKVPLPSVQSADSNAICDAHSESSGTDSPGSSRRMLCTPSWPSTARRNSSMSSCGGSGRLSRRSVSDADTRSPRPPPSSGPSS